APPGHARARRGNHDPTARRALEPHPRPAVADLDLEPAATAPDIRAAHRLSSLHDELRQSRRRDRDGAALTRDDVAHAAPTAASCFSSRKLVEYAPLRNSSLATISAARSRVVAMPRTSSSPSARSARSIASGRLSSHTVSFATSES